MGISAPPSLPNAPGPCRLPKQQLPALPPPGFAGADCLLPALLLSSFKAETYPLGGGVEGLGVWSKDCRRPLRGQVHPCATWSYILLPPRLCSCIPRSGGAPFLSLPICVHYIFQDPTLNKNLLNKTSPSIMTTKPDASEHSHHSVATSIQQHRYLAKCVDWATEYFIVYIVSSNKPRSLSEMNYFS